jgi:hypothetical protein
MAAIVMRVRMTLLAPPPRAKQDPSEMSSLIAKRHAKAIGEVGASDMVAKTQDANAAGLLSIPTSYEREVAMPAHDSTA